VRRAVLRHLELGLDLPSLKLPALVNPSADPKLTVGAGADRGLLPARQIRHFGHIGEDVRRRTRDLDCDLQARQS
jgi:hypothetical protein